MKDEEDPIAGIRGCVYAIPISIALWILIITAMVKGCEVLG